MRVNVGIRRRLAPLLLGGRRQIELMNCLLLSMPGTPIVYYGDELGMGDNIYLGDRNGVRTPMQWTGDRNGGFSEAETARLYCPPNVDALYGYQAINVEAQEKSHTSLLNWMKRIIRLRRRHPAFARGRFEALHPANNRVLAFLRIDGDDTLLVACNLSRYSQAAEIDLSRFAGWTPVELFGETPFPRIGGLPYPLTFGPHTFFWFRLAPPEAA
jgi:maltose alpha-D-glucosyltransferase/alpha-amylase